MLRQLPILFLSLLSFSQEKLDFCEQVTALQTLVETNHFSPKPLDNDTSVAIQELFLNALDSNKDYFLQSDIDTFKLEASQFDDYIKNNNCDFLSRYVSILENRITDIKNKLQALRSEKLDFSGQITLQYIPKKDYSYYKDEASLERGLRKRVSYRIISKLIDEENDVSIIKENFKTLVAKAKKTVIDGEICLLEEFINKSGGLDAFVKASFLNALVQVNDPNSTFFNVSEKITYENQLSKNQMSFGIITKKNDLGDIVIAHIIPGSAAFENGKFEEDDILKTVTSENERLETTCVSNNDITLFFNNEKNKTLSFSIKKKNGTLHDIKLTKSKIKVEDNAIRGYIIENDNKLGYIKIPSFYTNNESLNGRGLTADIAKELYKLQKESIAGLILDLRFNGGGSMQEAIELSGMFIDRGPVSIIKNKDGNDFTIRDNKRGTFFNKPLLILVNDYSASASEFFAAAMQDYNRAVIVGSTTYGKSSAQAILPISNDKDLGFSKLTVEAFYRVTGESLQSVGVVPDIKLPSLYDNFETAEQNKPHALKNTSTNVRLKHKVVNQTPITSIISKSKERVANNLSFQKIKKINTAFYDMLFKKGNEYKLTLESISEEKKRRKKLIDRIFTDDTNAPTLINVTNTKSTNELLEYNTDDKNYNKELLKTLAQDIYINEAQLILTDILNPN